MVLGVPAEIKTFFAKPVRDCAKPIRGALAAMVLAFLLAPNRRCLKTVAGCVLGHRRHVATISRRLTNPQWKTRDWYVTLYAGLQQEIDRWERRQAKGRRRQWIVAIDTTYHATMSEQMENLIVMSRRKDPRRQTTRFLCGFSHRSQSGPGPHAGAGRRVCIRGESGCLDAELVAEGVCPAGARDGQRRPRLRPPASCRQSASQEDPTATASQVIQWYEVRWQVELFFRELKSRMQFERYVLMKFEAVERYLDLLLMGLLLLEQQRLRDMQRDGDEVGKIWVQARTTDRLRMLEVLCQQWNADYLEERLRTPGGTRRVLRELRRRAPCQVA